MKRFITVLVIALAIPAAALAAQSEADREGYFDALSDYDLGFFETELDRDTYSYLEELGLSGFDYESISDMSADRAAALLKRLVTERLKSPLEGVLSVIVFVLLSSFFRSLSSGESQSSVYSTASAVVISVLLVSRVSPAVTLGASAAGVAASFIYSFVPVFAVIVAASGGITASFSTNTLLLLLSQGLSFVSSKLLIPLVNCFLALGICSGLRAELRLERAVSTMKKVITTVLSFTAGAYVSVLSLKTAVAAKADILGIRSMRFVISSVVPVVGGALSEGLLSIQSYSSLIKSSVGIVGIAATALVFLPALIELTLWRFALSVCLIISDIFGDSSVAGVLTAFKDAMLMCSVVLIISALTTVVSIGVLVAAGG